eukprot:CAMPEP_0196571726 /NCGR_PEP_ID=MMETSP1081-20130531/1854_1 /TAXON_ID=36882 /ORGANISM="Pyramimonas amylifera, Strain CCMP720" /LENGTH=228 /DNA_ID=CAMNT_0041888767 /DNA_START=126 /DNA_END=812 /DNA_ORIENTATION=+
MMVLQDAIKTRAIPPQMKVTQVLPTSGARSTSTWECNSVEEVETFVNELLSEWCVSECFEVVEESAYGLTAVDKTNASMERVMGTATAATSAASAATTAAVATTAAAVGQQWNQVDEKFHINDRVKQSWGKVAEFSFKARENTGAATAKAMENQTVAASVSALASTFGFIRTKASEVGGVVAEKASGVNSAIVNKVQSYNHRAPQQNIDELPQAEMQPMSNKEPEAGL